MRTYSREDAAKTPGRTRPPAQCQHKNTRPYSIPIPGPQETSAGYRSRESSTTLDRLAAASASRLHNARSSAPHTTERPTRASAQAII